jgi:predicted nucleic-acid-binding Zn-ribbon protein
MRTTATCPKCSGKKIVVTELRHTNNVGEVGERIDAIPVVGIRVRRSLTWDTKVVGTFESWICAACGYTELYAKDLGDVDKLAAERPTDVRIVDAAVPARGPFR